MDPILNVALSTVRLFARACQTILEAHHLVDQNVLSVQNVQQIKPVLAINAQTRVQTPVESGLNAQRKITTQYVLVHQVKLEIRSLDVLQYVSLIFFQIIYNLYGCFWRF